MKAPFRLRLQRLLLPVLFGCLPWQPLPAGAAELELASFEQCRAKPVACYQDVAEIRREQLASERERLFVAVERAEFEDYEQARKHRAYTLWGQFFQGWILLLIGIVIVGVGIVMSWQQMVRGLQDGASLDNAFELGRDGVRLRSPIVGLFIFGASIWFFNTYIDKVYTLTLLREEVQAEAAQPAAAQPAEEDPASDADGKASDGAKP